MKKLIPILLLAGCHLITVNPPTPPAECGAHVWGNGDVPFRLSNTSVWIDNTSGYPLDVSMWNGAMTVSDVEVDGSFRIAMKRMNDPGNGWLGLARVWAGPSGIILRADILMNEAYPLMADPAVYTHVGCMEVGHCLGLAHQDGAVDSCMNDCSGSRDWKACMSHPEATTPNDHDLEVLRDAYGDATPPVGCEGARLTFYKFPAPTPEPSR